jgi:hypothetical protein
VLYAASMWVAGIMQGLMWREYDDQGFLVNSFAEPWRDVPLCTCCAPSGGLMYLTGALVMAWNVYMTIRGDGARCPWAQRTRRRTGRIRRDRNNVTNEKHGAIERNATLLMVGSLVVVTIGGIVEIAPLFYLENTIEKVEGHAPLLAAGAGRTQHLHPRGLLCLPLAR